MKNKVCIWGILLLLLPMAAGCQKDPSAERREQRIVPFHEVTHGMIELGDQLEDPYALTYMQQSLSNLYPTKGGRVELSATDLYVRFLPESEEAFDELRRMGLELTDHPLDYEILREGDYYHDPKVGADRITWQYAVVPVGFSFPEDIRHEVLDECYLPDHAATKAEDVDWDAVEAEAYRITGNAALYQPASKAGDGQPTGKIEIIDDQYQDGQPIGVAGVRVVVNSFVKFASAYTDATGAYKIPRTFSTNLRYRLVFQNEKGFGIGVNLLLVPASVSTLGVNTPDGLSVCIDKDSERKLFCRCVVNNAAYDYFKRCTREGITVSMPPANLRLWVFQSLGNSSAPMLQQGAMIDGTVIGRFLGEYRDLVKMFLPDVTIGVDAMEDYASIYLATCHELAHASHYVQVGNAYWNKYISFVLRSFVTSGLRTYGIGTEPDAGYCEVGEMWGYYLQNKLCKERYGRYISDLGTTFWFYPQIFLYMDDRGVDDTRIFPALNASVTDRKSLQRALTDMNPEYRYIIDQAFERY